MRCSRWWESQARTTSTLRQMPPTIRQKGTRHPMPALFRIQRLSRFDPANPIAGRRLTRRSRSSSAPRSPPRSARSSSGKSKHSLGTTCNREPSPSSRPRTASQRRTPSGWRMPSRPECKRSGRKVSDEFTVPLCRTHHRDNHRFGDEVAWWGRQAIDPVGASWKLWVSTRRIE